MQKLYCYVDETGQDTDGRLFLVSIVGFIRDSLEGDKTMQILQREAEKENIIKKI